MSNSNPLLLLFLLLGPAACSAEATLTLRGRGSSGTTAVFGANRQDGATFGALASLSATPAGPSAVAAGTTSPVWSVTAVTGNDKYPQTTVQSTHGRAFRDASVAPSGSQASFLWSVPLATAPRVTLNVTMTVSVLSNDLLSYNALTFSSSDENVGIWAWTLYPAGETMLSEGGVFDPTGFGVVHHLANASVSFQRLYPQATMQFMASFPPLSSAVPGTYVAAHDLKGSSKTFGCAVASDGLTAKFSISATPPNAGLPLSSLPHQQMTVAFPIVVAVLNNTEEEEDWYAAAKIYREFVITSAVWTQQGPLSQRKDVPLWAQELTVWVNSHWQNNDIFDKSGGAPAVVEERVLDIVERFGLGNGTLGLHWYEWDTLGYVSGSNYSNCGSEITCGFDTHYPEYFPVRQNFQASLERMQQVGVRVTPYINGRIFDQATESWTDHSHEAKHAACKSTPASLLPDKKNIPLQLYNETYGSKAEFAVMCPHTQYWQHTLAGVVGELAHTYNTDGVYIDQIAAAGPRPCWDPSHNHSLGGGHHWQSGYAALLGSVRKNAGNSKLLLTESNAEPFMSGIDMFLTLVGFSVGDLSPPAPGATEQATYIVPAFQSVYGGYYLSMGAEFFPTDFVPNPDVFAAKLANQFLFGAQMGWFSLGGKDGIYNDLMDSAYDREVAYLRLLSKAKQTANKWLVHGRAMRRVAFVVNGTATNKPSRRQHVQVPNFRLSRAHYGTDKDRTDAGVSFDSVMSSSWYSKAMDGGSLLVLITTCERHSPATLMASMDMRRFGFDGDSVASEMFDVFDVPPDGLSPPKKVGTFKGAEVQLSVKLAARAVVLLCVTKSKRQY